MKNDGERAAGAPRPRCALRLAAVLTALLLAIPAAVAGQSSATLAKARGMLAAGQPGEALELLAGASTVEALSLKAEAAARARRFDAATAAYASFVKASGKDDPRLLNLFGQEYLREHDRSADRLARVQACDTLVRVKLHEQLGCLPTLRAWARANDEALPVRVAAAATAARAGDKDAGALLASLAKDAGSSSRRLLLSVLDGVPSGFAVPILEAMLEDPDGGVQFSAASALGEHRTPEAGAALRRYLAITDRRIARGAAERALAAQGDAAALKRLSSEVEGLTGGDLYAAGLALRAAGDQKGTEALVRIANGDHESLKPEAAAALVSSHPKLAASVFEASLGSKNPLVRAATLRAFRQAPLLTPAVLLAGLADESPEVRAEAALGLTIRYAAGAIRRQTPP